MLFEQNELMNQFKLIEKKIDVCCLIYSRNCRMYSCRFSGQQGSINSPERSVQQ